MCPSTRRSSYLKSAKFARRFGSHHPIIGPRLPFAPAARFGPYEVTSIEVASAGRRRRCRPSTPVQARGAGPRLAEPSQYRGNLWSRRHGRPKANRLSKRSCWSSSKVRRCQSVSPLACCRSTSARHRDADCCARGGARAQHRPSGSRFVMVRTANANTRTLSLGFNWRTDLERLALSSPVGIQ